MPSQAELVSRYVSGQISPIRYYERTKVEDARTFVRRLKLIKEFCDGKYLLDIGCNIGTLLEEAIKMGFVARGIDVNFMCREYGKLKGLKIDHAMSDTLPYQHPFDVIVMNEVLEHLINPREYLMMLKSHMSNNGIIFITTPDAGSWLRGLFKNRWIPLKQDEHLYLFNRKNIIRLAEGVGLKVSFIGKSRRYRTFGNVYDKFREVFGINVSWLPFKKFQLNADLVGEMVVILRC